MKKIFFFLVLSVSLAYSQTVSYTHLDVYKRQDCLNAMPKAKELEEKNPDVNFVFLSLDRNLDAWKKGLEKHEMTSKENYWFSEGWKNNFNNYIDLNWIPRYLIINQKSGIAKYYAITPDDPEIQKTIDELSK